MTSPTCPIASPVTSPNGRTRTPNTPIGRRPRLGRATRSTGGCSACPSRRSEVSATSPAWTSWSSGAARHTSRRGWRSSGRGRWAWTRRQHSSRPRGECRARPGSSSRSSRRPRSPCRCRMRRSTWPCPNTAPRCGPCRSGGWRRRRGCCGRAAGLVFLTNSTLATLCSPDDGAVGERLMRPRFEGLYRVEWPEGQGSSTTRPTAVDPASCARTGSTSRPCTSLQAPETGKRTRTTDNVTVEWARKWPCEDLWVARKVADRPVDARLVSVAFQRCRPWCRRWDSNPHEVALNGV